MYHIPSKEMIGLGLVVSS